jgi:hypothetical protein
MSGTPPFYQCTAPDWVYKVIDWWEDLKISDDNLTDVLIWLLNHDIIKCIDLGSSV